ncbi:MAG: D-lyxose/D-mannose family sugar isomerase [Clostridiales bacterium]|nr:D-lyxose/D-mannose family sugar isomerase [Clostridiales bacterium]
MITIEQFENAQKRASEYFEKACIVITEEERKRIEVVDFGLDDLEHMGLEILIYVNTSKVCAKELVLFPGQTCAEHIHPTIGNVPGKEETFRCRWGKVYLYVSGSSEQNACVSEKNINDSKDSIKYSKQNIMALIHDKLIGNVTAFREIVLYPGEQYTLMPDTLHWFQGGPEGAVVSEFSTTSTDELDEFTDPKISRFTKICS